MKFIIPVKLRPTMINKISKYPNIINVAKAAKYINRDRLKYNLFEIKKTNGIKEIIKRLKIIAWGLSSFIFLLTIITLIVKSKSFVI